MGTQDFGSMDPNASLKQVIDALADLMDTLNFLLNGNLDVKNIRAQSITADRMNVKQLSAIAADMGTLTAGIIYGAYIATSQNFPKIEFSSSSNLLKASSDANNHIDINPVYGGAPAINWFAAGAFAASLSTSSAVTQLVSAVQLLLQSTGNMTITSSAGNISLNPSGSTSLNGPTVALNPSGSLSINGSSGSSGGLTYAKPGGGSGTITITKGLITGFT